MRFGRRGAVFSVPVSPSPISISIRRATAAIAFASSGAVGTCASAVSFFAARQIESALIIFTSRQPVFVRVSLKRTVEFQLRPRARDPSIGLELFRDLLRGRTRWATDAAGCLSASVETSTTRRPYLRSVFRSIVGTRNLGALRLRRQSIEYFCGFQLQGQCLVSWKHDDQRRVILSLMSPEITGFCGLRPQPKRVERGHIAG